MNTYERNIEDKPTYSFLHTVIILEVYLKYVSQKFGNSTATYAL